MLPAMSRSIVCVVGALWAGCGGRGAVAPGASEPIALSAAQQVFAEAAARCGADRGALWGVSLCGPIMLVDRDSRFVVANQADELDKLRRDRGVFVGVLSADEPVANTAMTWSGVRWTQLSWPLPDEAAQRAVLVMHEAFHRIADQAHVPQLVAGDCAHLDTADGRYYLQLEWRALAAALQATDDPARRAAVLDALAFRQARQAVAPGAAANEQALELDEGLAEYTGIMVGLAAPAERRAAAIADLAAHVDDPSFVRSFAYATGPALGLLLDQYAAGWRQELARATTLGARLATALGEAALPDVVAAAARYDGPALHAAEQTRAAEHGRQLAAYRAQLVDGPVLKLAFRHMKIEFDPRDVVALDALGSVYPALRVTDDWGALEVHGGALLAADYSAVTVAAPAAGALRGPGLTLTLAAGWHVVPGPRAGDLQLAR